MTNFYVDVIEDLRSWLHEQHERSCGYTYAESFTGTGEPRYITAYSVTIQKLQQLEEIHG